MRKLATLCLTLGIVAATMSACGGSSSSAPAPAQTASQAVAAAPAQTAELPELTGGFETPILITSDGQSADANLVEVLCGKAQIECELDTQATPEALKGKKTLILAVGGSSKGLGAAGVDADQEKARVAELIKAAKEDGIKIVSMHVGGDARRGGLSDQFIPDAFGAADAAIIVAAGDTDGMMQGILAGNNTPTAVVAAQTDCLACLETLFK